MSIVVVNCAVRLTAEITEQFKCACFVV